MRESLSTGEKMGKLGTLKSNFLDIFNKIIAYNFSVIA